MPLTAQISAYEDCEDLYAKGAADPTGVRARFDSYAEAFHFQNRMHRFRDLQRQESKRIYKRDDEKYGKSMYDPLVVCIRSDGEEYWWVYVIRRAAPQIVESLSDPIEDQPPPTEEQPLP